MRYRIVNAFQLADDSNARDSIQENSPCKEVIRSLLGNVLFDVFGAIRIFMHRSEGFFLRGNGPGDLRYWALVKSDG